MYESNKKLVAQSTNRPHIRVFTLYLDLQREFTRLENCLFKTELTRDQESADLLTANKETHLFLMCCPLVLKQIHSSAKNKTARIPSLTSKR